MLLLTIEYRRANVAAFWLVGAATMFLAVGTAGMVLGATAPWTVAALGVAAMLLPGFVWRPWFEKGIWAWNGCVRRLAAALSMYILRVCYVFLLAPLGASHSSLDLSPSRSDRSRWVESRHKAYQRETLRGSVPQRDALHHGLLAFVRTPSNQWAAVLFPLVFLLGLLRDTRQEATPPGSTYTLY